ncbi:MAG: DUF2877 domain-containing protein [Anaerolineae bacterium]|nr:MAG: DUF2877 domain-containing protein [Anaerolineae bacterium]
MGLSNVRCLTTGFFTLSLCSEEHPLTVWGLTSRGIFLRAEEMGVLFLTPQPFRGPWTVNIAPHQAQDLEKLESGMQALATREGIQIPAARLQFQLRSAAIWQPPPRPAGPLTPQRQLALLAYDRRPSPLLGAVSGREEKVGALLYQSIVAIRNSLRRNRWQDIPDLARPLVGWGRGLTPSGDDLLLGMLLALHRWVVPAEIRVNLNRLHLRLTESVRTASTAVSAALVYAAGKGHADERLIRALDALAGAPLPHTAVIDELLGWGNSSGLDALAGMLLALDSATL